MITATLLVVHYKEMSIHIIAEYLYCRTVLSQSAMQKRMFGGVALPMFIYHPFSCTYILNSWT